MHMLWMIDLKIKLMNGLYIMDMSREFGGIGKDSIKANNVFAILSCIYKHAPVSRRDIAKMVNLTPSTVTLLVADMLRFGLVCEGDEVDAGSGVGRRMVQLGFDPGFGYMLGICIEPAMLSFSLVEMCGGDLSEKHIIACEEMKNVFTSDELLDKLLQSADAFLARQKKLKGRFCAVGISISGHVDTENGVSVNSYGVLPPQTGLTSVFETHYGVPAFLDNNVRSLAQAEMALQSDSGTVNGLFVKQDPGFGCTVLLNGEVFEGASNSSGEIGHTRVVNSGRPCSCGKTGCLSTVVGTNALLESAAAVLSPNATPSLWSASGGRSEKLTVPVLVQSAADGDGPIVLLLEEAARLMASVIETSLLLMDGDCVITFGPLFAHDWFLHRLQNLLDESFGPFRCIQVLRSRLSDGERWKGAALSAQRRYLKVLSGEISIGAFENED